MLQPARFLGLFVLVVALLLHTSGCLSVAQAPAPGDPSVLMKEFEFTPEGDEGEGRHHRHLDERRDYCTLGDSDR